MYLLHVNIFNHLYCISKAYPELLYNLLTSFTNKTSYNCKYWKPQLQLRAFPGFVLKWVRTENKDA